jgi:hypothetical protein
MAEGLWLRRECSVVTGNFCILLGLSYRVSTDAKTHGKVQLRFAHCTVGKFTSLEHKILVII